MNQAPSRLFAKKRPCHCQSGKIKLSSSGFALPLGVLLSKRTPKNKSSLFVTKKKRIFKKKDLMSLLLSFLGSECLFETRC